MRAAPRPSLSIAMDLFWPLLSFLGKLPVRIWNGLFWIGFGVVWFFLQLRMVTVGLILVMFVLASVTYSWDRYVLGIPDKPLALRNAHKKNPSLPNHSVVDHSGQQAGRRER